MTRQLRYLLDTNICIYVINKKSPALLEKFNTFQQGSLAMSVVTWGELVKGAQKSRETERAMANLDIMRQLVPVLAMAHDVGNHYGEIVGALEKQGQPIGGNDSWIAAHARSLGLTLVTNNEREFKRVPGLAVDNWV